MESIIPLRSQVSDRFPIASFAVQVPRHRFFEIACATDPALFHLDARQRRTPRNFYSTRVSGLLNAPQDRTTWILPPEQLRRFVGAQRVYYALATYGGHDGREASFSIAPHTLDKTPSIGLSSDFTASALDRSRLGGIPTKNSYGAPHEPLVWGGDMALAEQLRAKTATATYGDGFDDRLWSRGHEDGSDDTDTETEEEIDAVAAQGMDAPDEANAEDEPEEPGAYGGGYGDSDEPEEVAQGLCSESGGDDVGASGLEADDVQREYRHDVEDDDEVIAGGSYGGAVYEAEEIDAEEESSGYRIGGGRAIEYASEDDDDMEPAMTSTAQTAQELTIRAKVEILTRVAFAESGADTYSAINDDTEYRDPGHPAYQKYHIGLSWGFIQFTQRSGNLGRVLTAAAQRSANLLARGEIRPETSFEGLFGQGDSAQLLQVCNANTEEGRVQPVAGHVLWEEPWVSRFRKAGRIPYVQAAQNEIGVLNFVDQNLQFAAWLGLNTSRALTMLVDRCVHMGNGGGRRFWIRAIGSPVGSSRVAQALEALGCADLQSFQKRYAPHLTVDGKLGANTQAALIHALGQLPSSPIALPNRDDQLRMIAAAAKNTNFTKRVQQLMSATDFDDTMTWLIP